MKNAIIAALLFVPSIIWAQEPWSLEQCIDYALQNNLQVKQQELSVMMDKGDLFQSKMSLLPSLNANGSKSYYFDRAITYGTNQPISGNITSTSVSLNASVSLFKGFQKYNTVKLNEFNLLSTLSDVEKIKNNIALSVASAYLQILYYNDLVISSNRQVELSKLQVERTKLLVNAGSLPEGNLLEIDAQLSSDELQLVNAQNQLDIATLNLTQLLEIKTPEGFTVQNPNLDGIVETIVEQSPNGIFDVAQASMPQIRSAEYRVTSAQKTLNIARGGLSPSLNLSGYFGSTAEKLLNSDLPQMPFMDQIRENVSKSITFSLTIPIFNGWYVKNNISNAKIGLSKARLTLETEKNILYKDIQQAYTDATAAQKKLKASNKSLIALEESYRYTEQKFNVGLVTSYDYTNAKTKLSKAESDLLQAKYELIFKLKILDFYKGNPLKL